MNTYIIKLPGLHEVVDTEKYNYRENAESIKYSTDLSLSIGETIKFEDMEWVIKDIKHIIRDPKSYYPESDWGNNFCPIVETELKKV